MINVNSVNSSGHLSPELKKRIRQDVQSMHAYAIQDSVGMVKLDAMENPHRLPAHLQAELGRRLGALALNRYPDGRVNDLRRALADYAGMPEGFDIMLGNGSDELISLLSLACNVPGGSVLAPEPGFVMYAMSAQLQGLAFVGVSLTADFELDETAMLAAIDEHQPSIVYLAYPNNPTANLWDDAVIEKIITAVGEQGGLVVMDEAYQPFSSKSYLDRISRHGHVLLMRTLSKFGLAGVRLGYMMGPKALIAEIDKVRPPYNISVLNYECALFALEHLQVFAAQAADLVLQRERLLKALRAMPGLTVWNSDANMILVRVLGQADAAGLVFERLKAGGVLVKNISKMHPLLANCLRLTVGTADENTQLLATLQKAL
jgi:histidinol-phosphate aminotransferase